MGRRDPNDPGDLPPGVVPTALARCRRWVHDCAAGNRIVVPAISYDWIIDLGPGAGHDGGRIVFAGTPADLVAARSTLTGEHLAAYVGP
jgi:hypothetical protein